MPRRARSAPLRSTLHSLVRPLGLRTRDVWLTSLLVSAVLPHIARAQPVTEPASDPPAAADASVVVEALPEVPDAGSPDAGASDAPVLIDVAPEQPTPAPDAGPSEASGVERAPQFMLRGRVL